MTSNDIERRLQVLNLQMKRYKIGKVPKKILSEVMFLNKQKSEINKYAPYPF